MSSLIQIWLYSIINTISPAALESILKKSWCSSYVLYAYATSYNWDLHYSCNTRLTNYDKWDIKAALCQFMISLIYNHL